LGLMTGESMLQAQDELRTALGCVAHSDPNEFLAFRLPLQEGSELLWASDGEASTLESMFAAILVASATDSDDHDLGLFVVSCMIRRASWAAPAYLLVWADRTEGIGGALPIAAEAWDAMFPFSVSGEPVPIYQNKTCAELAVDWCTEWCPPCDPSQMSGLGGLISCFEEAKCRAEDCHHLACITNAADCCERGHGPTYCWWEQYLSQGENLEHVACDTVLTVEKGLCMAEALRKILTD